MGMKSISVTFTDEEFTGLVKAKEDLSWHDFLMTLVEADTLPQTKIEEEE